MKNRLCIDCIYYNNGWCKVKLTNKGLNDKLFCESKEVVKENPVGQIDIDTSQLSKLENTINSYLSNKKMEYDIDKSEYTRGMIDGIAVILKIIKAAK